jgi:hypothetical protein
MILRMRGAVLLVFLAACGGQVVTLSHPELEAEAIRDEIVDVTGATGRTLDLVTPAGDILIEVAEGTPHLVARMRIMARTEAEATRLLARFSVSGREVADTLVVRLDGEPQPVEGTGLRVEPLVSFLARVPPGQRLRVETGSGRAEVKGAAGDCTLETAFGDVKIFGARGESVRARTSSGSVQIEDVQAGQIEVDTSFGDVRVEGVRGDLDVEAGSGDVILAGFAEGRCGLETGFGNIDARGSFVELLAKTSSGRIGVLAEPGSRIARPWTLHSSFGDVELRVPTPFDCSVFAETSFGSVTSDVEMRRQGQPSDHRVRGDIGGGGGRVTLRTSSGDIRIRGTNG